jgi:hypothetical protein
MPKIINMAGLRFGRLTAVRRVGKNEHRQSVWLFLCDCGQEIERPGQWVRKGDTLSCGCLKKDKMTTHGEARSRLYRIWQGMVRRCYLPSASSYSKYGGRGIGVCAEWRGSYCAFRDWSAAHEYAPDLQIERIDVNGNYEPANCKWATRDEQNLNKRCSRFVQFNGQRVNYVVAAKALGLPRHRVWQRLARGFSDEAALAVD